MKQDEKKTKSKPAPHTSKWQADQAINTPREDKFDRLSFTKSIARDLRNWRGKESLVISLNGEWGSGKTSAKNLILHELNKCGTDISVVQFNPWLVTGEEAITKAFFDEVAVTLEKAGDPDSKKRLEAWRKYSRLLGLGSKLAGGLEVAGLFVPTLAAIGGSSKKALKKASELADTAAGSLEVPEVSLTEHKSQLKALFAELPCPVLVVIDDIDRLTTEEIRLVIQLIKSNADFPNLIYLLLYQKDIVAKSLGGTTMENGFNYLQKIVQIDLDLPQPRKPQLKKFFGDLVDPILSRANIDWGWDVDRWQRIANEAVWPFYQTPRSVMRFQSMLDFYYDAHVEDGYLNVNPIDLMLLETLRLANTEAFNLVSKAFKEENNVLMDLLFDTKEVAQRFQVGLKELLERDSIPDDQKEPLKALITALFPQAKENFSQDSAAKQEWLRELRICHSKHFSKYFHLRPEPQETTAAYISEVIHTTTDDNRRREMIADKFVDLDSFEAFSDYLDSVVQDVPKEILNDLCLGIFDLSDNAPPRNAGLLRQDPSGQISDLVHRLLSQIEDSAERSKTFQNIIENTTGLSGPTYFVSRHLPEDEDPDPRLRLEPLIEQDKIKAAREIMTAKLFEGAKNGNLLSTPASGYLLYRLVEWGDPKDLLRWTSSAIKDKEQGILLLRAVMTESHRSGGGESQYIYEISISELEKFISKAELKKVLPYETEDELERLLVSKVTRWANGKEVPRRGERIFIATKDVTGKISDNAKLSLF